MCIACLQGISVCAERVGETEVGVTQVGVTESE